MKRSAGHRLVRYLLLVTGFLCSSAFAGEASSLYSTGTLMEVDRCASAWLIKRYIDPDAEFLFFKDGEFITRGIAFDTPDARFSRTHNLSTFEVLMRHFKVKDPRLAPLTAAIHELEINFWARKNHSPLARQMDKEIGEIIRTNEDPARCVKTCMKYLDNLLEQPAD